MNVNRETFVSKPTQSSHSMNMKCRTVTNSIIFTWILLFSIYQESHGSCSISSVRVKNGWYKVRSRGRILKFYCSQNYDLFGKRYTTCIRGSWNYPFPVCVTSVGCTTLVPPVHGILVERANGAIATYECDPGYSLTGSSTIYCDGESWNDTIPTCEVSTDNPSTSCTFEKRDLCGWEHDPTGDFYWTRHQFATPSGHVGTGPNHDHTYGMGKSGYYMYIEASSPRKINDTARLYSPVYSPSLSKSCFIFWYHMYGSAIGSLRVYVKSETENLASLYPVWEKSGDQGNVWLKATVPIHPLHDNFQIVIEGVRGASYVSDIAIDDVSLEFENCQKENISLSCQGRCGQDDADFICGCNAKCIENYNCCDDYAICILDKINNVSLTDLNVTSSKPVTSVTNATIGEIIDKAYTTSSDDITTTIEYVWTNVTESINTSTMDHPIASLSIETMTSTLIEVTTTNNVYYTEKQTRYPRTRWWRSKIRPSSLSSEKPSVDYAVVGIFLGVLILISVSIVMIYFWRRRHKKLNEDSDMRYLPDNEIIEYYDSQKNSDFQI